MRKLILDGIDALTERQAKALYKAALRCLIVDDCRDGDEKNLSPSEYRATEEALEKLGQALRITFGCPIPAAEAKSHGHL